MAFDERLPAKRMDPHDFGRDYMLQFTPTNLQVVSATKLCSVQVDKVVKQHSEYAPWRWLVNTNHNAAFWLSNMQGNFKSTKIILEFQLVNSISNFWDNYRYILKSILYHNQTTCSTFWFMLINIILGKKPFEMVWTIKGDQ